MNKKRKEIVERLKRLFPNLNLINESYLFNDENDCCPDEELSWNDILDKMEKNGLTIVDK